MEKEDFLRSGDHGIKESQGEMTELDSAHDDSHQEHHHIIRSKLESAKVEIEEAKEENRRLKSSLNNIKKDYDNLQAQYNQLMAQDEGQHKISSKRHYQDKEVSEREELVSLRLGRRAPVLSAQMTNKEEKNKEVILEESVVDDNEKSREQGLSVGMEYKALNNRNDKLDTDHIQETTSLELGKHIQIPSDNSLGFKNDGDDNEDEDEILPQNLVKKTRVSVRSRCETPTMNDGCQWRKYGQKIAKGNPCPRAYYRCTIAASCPVRKQVQRCSDDMSILISTYEGIHNHPLPISATAMASATSAAASMLLSRVSSSSSSFSEADLHGLNFSLSGNNITLKPISPFLQTSSTSSSSAHPTVTIDLTTSSSPHQPFLSMLDRFKPPPNNFSRSNSYPFTNLNFSNNTNTLMNWGGGVSQSDQYSATYGNISKHQQFPFHNIIQTRTAGSSFDPFGTSSPSHTTQTNIGIKNNVTHQVPFIPTETIKAITTDPSFQSALAVALSSIISDDKKADRNEAKKSP